MIDAARMHVGLDLASVDSTTSIRHTHHGRGISIAVSSVAGRPMASMAHSTPGSRPPRPSHR